MSLACGECGGVSPPLRDLLGVTICNVRARIGRESALSSYEFACIFGSLGDFSLPLHSQKKRMALR